MTKKYVLALHGGAENIRGEKLEPAYEQACERALTEIINFGDDLLQSGCDAVECVMQVVSQLEDNDVFNAGKGSVYNQQGQVECDAAIMNGATLEAGAVVAIQQIKNPIQAARLVMEQCQHVMLAGQGAEAFAQEHGMAFIDPSYFKTDYRTEEYRQARDAYEHMGTVGVVALDQAGHLAAGTSTGGINLKLPQRIGDSAIIGAGTYANQHVAVSCTGQGEYFIRLCLAHKIAVLMETQHHDLATVAGHAIHGELSHLKALGGLIAIDYHGNIAMPMNTDVMFRATSNQGDINVAIYR